MSDQVLRSNRFPNLAAGGYHIKSSETPAYNCIAWTMGDVSRWWWPHPQAYWPENCPLEESITAFEAMFVSLGYVRGDGGDFELGKEKIALYALHGSPTHAAKQMQDGSWISKIGQHKDIEHTLRGLEGPRYGQVVSFFVKPTV